MSRVPIALIHWGDPLIETEELREIDILTDTYMEQLSGNNPSRLKPDFAIYRAVRNSRDDLKDCLFRAFDEHPGIQILYISAHGSRTGLYFAETKQNSTGVSKIDYELFGQMLARASYEEKSIELVMGSCYAMATLTDITAHLPKNVISITGFTVAPSPHDVAALMAAKIIASASLATAISELNTASIGKGVPESDMSSNLAALAAAIDLHLETNPEDLTSIGYGKGGHSVIEKSRIAGGMWKDRKMLLHPKK